MSDANIKLIFQAVDRASASIKNIEAALNRLENSTKSATLTNNALTGAIGVGFVAAQAAIGAATFAADQFVSTLTQASEIELSNLSAASGLETALGSFDNASQFVDKLNDSLATAAATLPGTTAQYTALARTISDDVTEAFTNASGKISDTGGFQKTLESISKNYTILGVGSNVTERATQQFLTNALSGQTSSKQLAKLDAVRKDARLRTALDDALIERGVTDIKKLNIQQRVELLQSVGEKLITPEYLKRVTATYDSTIQGFLSRLFDPNTGAFGLLRDLDKKAPGNQTAFDSVKKVLNSLIGDGGLFDSIAAIGDRLGLTIDPMVELRNGLDNIDLFIKNLTKIAKFIDTSLLEGFSVSQIAAALGGNRLGENLAKFINNIFSYLIGESSNADYGGIVKSIFSALTYIGEQLKGFLLTLDVRIYAIALGSALFVPVMTAIGASITTAVLGALGTFTVTFGASILAGLGAAIAGFPVLLFVGAVAGVTLLVKAIYDNFDAIKSVLGQVFKPVFDVIFSIGEFAVGALTGNIPLIKDAISRFFGSFRDAINGFTDLVAIATGGQTSGQANAAEVERRSYEKLAAAQKYNARYAGYIPNAASGFFGALSRESRNMPSGASPVIANSSETILTAAQSANVARSIGTGGTFAPTVNIYGANMDLEQLAGKVMSELEGLFRTYKESYL